MSLRRAARPRRTQCQPMPEWPQRRRRDASHPCRILIDEGGGHKGRRLLEGYAMKMSWFFSGNERIRLPVALKNALSTAGAATQMVGSPTPPQTGPPFGMMIDSTFGISAIRIEL